MPAKLGLIVGVCLLENKAVEGRQEIIKESSYVDEGRQYFDPLGIT